MYDINTGQGRPNIMMCVYVLINNMNTSKNSWLQRLSRSLKYGIRRDLIIDLSGQSLK